MAIQIIIMYRKSFAFLLTAFLLNSIVVQAMAGVKNYSTVQQTDGKSFVQYLKNPSKTNNNRSLIWNFPNNWTAENNSYVSWLSAIRKGDWKLIYFERPGKLVLYDLKNDIHEQKDLAAQYPEKVKALASRFPILMK